MNTREIEERQEAGLPPAHGLPRSATAPPGATNVWEVWEAISRPAT
jgi:hypothetical protein